MKVLLIWWCRYLWYLFIFCFVLKSQKNSICHIIVSIYSMIWNNDWCLCSKLYNKISFSPVKNCNVWFFSMWKSWNVSFFFVSFSYNCFLNWFFKNLIFIFHFIEYFQLRYLLANFLPLINYFITFKMKVYIYQKLF